MKVLIVDDHLMFRLGIRSVIEQQRDIKVVGEAASYLEAILMIEQTKPDVTVLDLRMPGDGGISVLDEAKKRGFSTKFLILSSYASEEEIYQAIRAGASGYILKDVDKAQLIQALRDVNDGRRHIPLPIQTVLESRESMRDLTPRELGGAAASREGADKQGDFQCSRLKCEYHTESDDQHLCETGRGGPSGSGHCRSSAWDSHTK